MDGLWRESRERCNGELVCAVIVVSVEGGCWRKAGEGSSRETKRRENERKRKSSRGPTIVFSLLPMCGGLINKKATSPSIRS